MRLSENELAYGPVILKTGNPVFIRHIQRKINLFQQAWAQAKDPGKRDALVAKIANLRGLIA